MGAQVSIEYHWLALQTATLLKIATRFIDAVGHGFSCHVAKNSDGKKVWQIRTVGSLFEKNFGE